jgi:hypothetical protein
MLEELIGIINNNSLYDIENNFNTIINKYYEEKIKKKKFQKKIKWN